jgi:hypothetical protein
MGSRGVMELGREQDSSEDELDALGDGASSASGASAADAGESVGLTGVNPCINSCWKLYL